jgi:hypothetical protein
MHILPTAIRELLRHTGARCFVRSGAIGYDGAVLWNFIEVLSKLFLGHPDRIRQFLIRFRPGLRVSDVDKRELLAAIHPFFYFVGRDSGYFHATFPLRLF